MKQTPARSVSRGGSGFLHLEQVHRSGNPASQAQPAPVGTRCLACRRPVFGEAEQNALVKQYCVTCHNDRAKAGQMSLAAFDAAQAADHLDALREDDSQAARAA